MNHILILLSAILIVGISAPAYAQTISENVVINEVDTNEKNKPKPNKSIINKNIVLSIFFHQA